MSQWVNEDGVTIIGKGRNDRRLAKGGARAATEPRRAPGKVSINVLGREPEEGQDNPHPHPWFLTVDELFDLADVLDALCEYVEDTGYGE